MDKRTSEHLVALWRREPDRSFDAIVTVAGDPAGCAVRVEQLELTVRRTFTLTRKLAVSGPARAFLALNARDWVIGIEEDRPIRTVPEPEGR